MALAHCLLIDCLNGTVQLLKKFAFNKAVFCGAASRCLRKKRVYEVAPGMPTREAVSYNPSG
jgi:hypothetical protein